MTAWWDRFAARLVPAEWRSTVLHDLEEEARRDGRGWWWLGGQTLLVAITLRWRFSGDTAMTDIRYALRSLLAARWFTAGAVLTFALGIGLNVAVFSAVDRLLFRSLPYAHPEQMVLLRSCDRTTGECGVGSFPAAVGLQLSQQSSTLTDLAVAGFSTTLTPVSDPENDTRFSFTNVSPRILRALGVSPRMGRDLSDDDIAAKKPAVWLSDEAWRGQFGADLNVIGRTLWAGKTQVSVLGVLPPGFIPPAWTSQDPSWTGLAVEYGGWTGFGPTGRTLVPVARLKPGATLAAAQAEVDALARVLPPDPRAPNAPPEYLRVASLEEALFSRYRAYLWLVVATVAMVLLIACANLSMLFLARGRAREQLAATCLALGASPFRVLRASIIESLIVCAAGAALACGVLVAAARLMSFLLPPIFTRYAAGLGDVRVVAFSLLATVVCALVAGTLPGWRVARVDVLPLLQKGYRSGGRARLRGGRGLIALEAALGAALLLGAVLALRSFHVLTQEHLGLEPKGLYVAMIGNRVRPANPADLMESQRTNMGATVAALATMPGVVAVGAGDYFPVSNEAPVRGFAKDVRQGARVQITPGYFAAIGTQIVSGRDFTADEAAGRAPVAIVNRLGARLLWPDAPPDQVVGRFWEPSGETARQIIGVVENAKTGYGDLRPVRALAYLPMGAEPTQWRRALVRMADGRPLTIQTVRTVLQARVPDVLATDLTYVPQSLDVGVQDGRFRAALLSMLALTGLLLAVLGLYAVTSFDAALRRHEMGVRLTLGAQPRDLKRLILREACAPVLVGALAGLVGAWWGATFVQSFLYQTDGRRPSFYIGVVVLLVATAALAALVPARRASRTDPAIVLRAQ